jgi:putative SOS response-associated peptidase YedK
MCGRYALYTENKVKKKFNIQIKANYNITPNSRVLVLNNELYPEFMKWGIAPGWSKNKVNIINARNETLQEKPDFKNSLRCIFIADGYYEWKKDKGYKRPFYHFQKKHFLFFAGIYHINRGCCIVTKQSHFHISHIHHRQPLLLKESDIKNWVNYKYSIKNNNFDLTVYEVSNEVNNPMNNGKSNIKPIFDNTLF